MSGDDVGARFLPGWLSAVFEWGFRSVSSVKAKCWLFPVCSLSSKIITMMASMRQSFNP